jgi:hypothetical protein
MFPSSLLRREMFVHVSFQPRERWLVRVAVACQCDFMVYEYGRLSTIGLHLPFNQVGVALRHDPKFDILDFVFRGPVREQLFVAVEPNDDDADSSRKLLRDPRLI